MLQSLCILLPAERNEDTFNHRNRLSGGDVGGTSSDMMLRYREDGLG